MRKLIVQLPDNRDYTGILHLEDERRDVLIGPFFVCGRADEVAARVHDNPGRDPLLPFGDTPLGGYRLEGIIPSGSGSDLPAEHFGAHGVVVLRPTAGEAALADANGRFHVLIQGGRAGARRRLRPTNGSLRLANRDQKRLIGILRKYQDITCECRRMAPGAATRLVAVSSLCNEGDPARGVSMQAFLRQPLVRMRSADLEFDRTPFPQNPFPRRFAPPPFTLFASADTGGGRGGDGGGGYEPDVPADDTQRNEQISNAISYLNEKAAPDYTGAQGECATYVGNAVREAGIQLQHIGGQGYAKDMGPTLIDAGFTVVPSDSARETGDVAVIQSYPGGDPAGHAAIWNGEQWVSDYKQGTGRSPDLPYPNDSYRKLKTPYVIYRWPSPKN